MPEQPPPPDDPLDRAEQVLNAQVRKLLPDYDQCKTDLSGTQVGHYRLLKRIGEGSFGDVYLARQDHPSRDVALKVIKLGMDSKEVLARFESERQALALMNHPNVARVFDAGTTEQGRPYFVMEYVDGVPITEHCDRQRLGIQQRLELFQQVCAGVQHAHHKAIVHRDIKPTNVLVAYVDSVATPKIIDFGVAKSTQKRLTEKTCFTQMGQLIGTPEYMSPEQAEMSGQDVDARTDVYSLGVLLYELLTGTLPFDPQELRRQGYAAIQRIIREQQPPRPSLRLSGLAQAADEVAKRRSTQLNRLSTTLRGELDWIVMKCLEKERGRRYVTPDALADDVGRYLHNEPVVARPPSAAFHLREFTRKHQGAMAAGLVVVMVLVGATVISALFATTARTEHLQPKQEGDHARAAEAAQQQLTNSDPEGVAKMTAQGQRESTLRAGLDEVARAEAESKLQRAEAERQLAEVEAAAAAAQAAADATRREAEYQQLRKRAEDLNVQRLYAPFLSKGRYIMGTSPARRYDVPRPVSFSGLVQRGAISSASMFARAGAGEGHPWSWNDRPKWAPAKTEEDLKRYEGLLQQFKELAPIWIELGLLQK